MKTKTLITILLLCNAIFLPAQNVYYWADNAKRYLTPNELKRFVLVDSKDTSIVKGFFSNHKITYSTFNQLLLDYKDQSSLDQYWVVASLIDTMDWMSCENIIYDAPFFITQDSVEVGLSHLFYVKLWSLDDTLVLQYFSNIHNVKILGNSKYRPLWFTLSCSNNSTGNSMETANLFYESGLFDAAEPDIMVQNFKQCTNDSLFLLQWNLLNTGQNDGVPGVDIKYCGSRNLTTGDSDIVIAIIDEGVDNQHPDLNNFSPISRDLIYQTSPASIYGPHGTACAGIIGATSNNTSGISGIAPSCPLMSISTNFNYQVDVVKRMADGIDFAWQNGAAVISNSWTIEAASTGQINTAILNAVSQGRDGKGCVVVFASGNKNRSSVEYPASNENVISVGAVDRCGFRCIRSDVEGESCDYWDNYHKGSSYGQRLDVVAPGVSIVTTDKHGPSGYSYYDYTEFFLGTSSACPHVSGVAALMLSVNPNLTYEQVRDIIRQTAQKVGGYDYDVDGIHICGTWNEYVGYGLLNAQDAVATAKLYHIPYAILGESLLNTCNEYVYHLAGEILPGFEIIWETSPDLCILSGQGTSSIKVRPLSSNSNNYVKAKICFQEAVGKTVVKNLISSIGSGYPAIVNAETLIDQNSLWAFERSLGNMVTVDSGAVLTITNTIHCTDSARIIVRPGGKLIVDGGTLTSACTGEMWQGIFVEGHRNLHQTAANQGTVVLRNGAVIENALRGIRTGAPGDNWNTTGGIVQCSNSTFHNNRKAVAFYPYADIVCGTTVRDNFSGFSNCTFTVDNDNLFASNNTSFDAHATLWDVKGVTFEGCTFTNATTAMTFDKGYAIKSIDAGFRVATLCDIGLLDPTPVCQCPERQATYSQFSGFLTAISASTSGNTYYVLVDEAQFSNNGTGIYISGNNHVTVTRNDFDMNSLPGTIIEGTGLSLNSCSGYLVEENSFHRTSLSGPFPFEGICVTNSGTAANLLYRNDFSHLNKAVTVVGTNGGSQKPVGLVCSCNSFQSNVYDFYVAASSNMSPQQGSASAGADNSFLNTSSSSLYNAGTVATDYYYSGATFSHVPYNPTANVTLRGHATANPCQSTLCGSGNVLPPPGPIKSPDAGYLALKAQYDTLLSEFESRGYADIVADPSEDLHSQADILSARLAFAQLGELERELHTRSNSAVRALLRDTLLDLPALESWFAATPGLSSRYSLAETEYLSGESNAMTLQGVSALLETEEERDEYDNYMAFNALKEALSGYLYGHADWPSATGTQIAELQRIADANTGRSSVMARGVLCFFFGICEDEDFTVMGDPRHFAATGENDISSHHQDVSMKLYPNPATNTLHVEFEGLDDPQGTITVADITGVVVQHVETSQRGVTIDVSHLTPGLYVVSFRNKNGVAVRKFVKM